MYRHIPALWLQFRRMVTHSYGSHCTKCAWIKGISLQDTILQPVDPSSDEPIWVICDASASGIGAVYGQGQTWQTCRPTGFMSKKFTGAQMNYCVFKMETIAILEALLKWEDKLISNRLNVVTDHRALEFFKI